MAKVQFYQGVDMAHSSTFYGDVLDECSAPYMIAFPADIAILRNTHAFRFGKDVTNAYAQRFFAGLQLCLAPLGVMIVNEDGKDGRRFEIQCVNA